MTELEQLPARIDDLTLQVSQLRTEVRVEFFAIRKEMADQGEGLRTELRTEIGSLKNRMLVLHEEVISRIALLQEGWPARLKRKPKSK